MRSPAEIPSEMIDSFTGGADYGDVAEAEAVFIIDAEDLAGAVEGAARDSDGIIKGDAGDFGGDEFPGEKLLGRFGWRR